MTKFLNAKFLDTVVHGSYLLRVGYMARTALSIILTLFGLLALTFFIGRLLPTDPVVAIIGHEADQTTYDTVSQQLGLDRPLYIQFGKYLWAVMHGDFGKALFTGNRVVDDIRRVFPVTLELAVIALAISTLIGIPLGVWAAVNRNGYADHLVRFFGLAFNSIPHFWLGMMALVVFYAQLGWIGGAGRVEIYFLDIVRPVTGMILVDSLISGEYEVFWDAVRHLTAPILILALGGAAFKSRMTRSFMLEQLNQEYIVSARAKGLTKSQVVWRHAFRNVTVPLVTIVALSFAGLLDGAVLTETVFSLPGFGQYTVQGLLMGDMNAVLTCTLLVGFIFISFNLLSDLLYRVFDPRTR